MLITAAGGCGSDPLAERTCDAQTAFDAQRWEDAIEITTAIIELEPEDTDILAQAYLNRSVANGQLGRVDQEIEDASAAIELDPDDTNIVASAYVGRSFANRQRGAVGMAAQDASAAIAEEAAAHLDRQR